MYRVLLVDDDMIVRMYLNEIVCWEEHDFEVVGTASNGEQAIELCREQDPDLILTDISMPRMDGIRMIQHLRSEGYDGVILVLSCHDDFELVKSAMKQGADDYLLKNHLSSDSFGELLEKIRVQVDERREQSKQRQTIQTFAHRGLRSAQRELMEDILRGEYSNGDLTQQMQQAGLHGKYRRVAMILVRAVDAYEQQRQDIQQMYIPIQVGYAVRRAAQYVQEHYAEPIGLANAAEAAELTTSYLSALFKKEMGIGFAEYLLNIRLNQVKRWLQDSDMSIAELSNRAGFTNYQHFCKTFKKKVGISPRDYRQRIRRGEKT